MSAGENLCSLEYETIFPPIKFEGFPERRGTCCPSSILFSLRCSLRPSVLFLLQIKTPYMEITDPH